MSSEQAVAPSPTEYLQLGVDSNLSADWQTPPRLQTNTATGGNTLMEYVQIYLLIWQ